MTIPKVLALLAAVALWGCPSAPRAPAAHGGFHGIRPSSGISTDERAAIERGAWIREASEALGRGEEEVLRARINGNRKLARQVFTELSVETVATFGRPERRPIIDNSAALLEVIATTLNDAELDVILRETASMGASTNPFEPGSSALGRALNLIYSLTHPREGRTTARRAPQSEACIDAGSCLCLAYSLGARGQAETEAEPGCTSGNDKLLRALRLFRAMGHEHAVVSHLTLLAQSQLGAQKYREALVSLEPIRATLLERHWSDSTLFDEVNDTGYMAAVGADDSLAAVSFGASVVEAAQHQGQPERALDVGQDVVARAADELRRSLLSATTTDQREMLLDALVRSGDIAAAVADSTDPAQAAAIDLDVAEALGRGRWKPEVAKLRAQRGLRRLLALQNEEETSGELAALTYRGRKLVGMLVEGTAGAQRLAEALPYARDHENWAEAAELEIAMGDKVGADGLAHYWRAVEFAQKDGAAGAVATAVARVVDRTQGTRAREAALERAIRLSPMLGGDDTARLHRELADVLIARGKLGEAIELLEHAITWAVEGNRSDDELGFVLQAAWAIGLKKRGRRAELTWLERWATEYRRRDAVGPRVKVLVAEAKVLNAADRPDEAMDTCQRAVAATARTLISGEGSWPNPPMEAIVARREAISALECKATIYRRFAAEASASTLRDAHLQRAVGALTLAQSLADGPDRRLPFDRAALFDLLLQTGRDDLAGELLDDVSAPSLRRRLAAELRLWRNAHGQPTTPR